MDKPPLDIEQAIDLILATPSMFSKRNEAQRDFGKLIVEEYYSKLRAENKDNATAYKYLVNLFALISSAVRAFGVQHSIFETRWQTIEEIKQHELEAAKRLTDYSPFRGGKFWEKLQGLVVSLLGGGGVGAVVGILFKTDTYKVTLIIALALVGGVGGIIGLDYLLHKMKDGRISSVLNKYPTDITQEWKAQIMPQYKKIIYNFLVSAIKVREEFYPNLPTFENLRVFQSNVIPHIQFEKIESGDTSFDKERFDEYINNIIDRHFAF